MKSRRQFTDILNSPFSTSLILQAAAKFAPGIGTFVSGAYSAGYAADEIVDFLRNKYGNQDQRRDQTRLQERSEKGIARADEQAALTRMEQRQARGNALQSGFKLGAQALGGALGAGFGFPEQKKEESEKQALEKPQNLPQIEEKKAIPPSGGANAQNVPPNAPNGPIAPNTPQEPPKYDASKGFLAQFPELGKFIEQKIESGMSPIEAAKEARKKRLFGPLIDKVERDAGKFEDVVAYLFKDKAPTGKSKEDPVEAALLNLIKKIGG